VHCHEVHRSLYTAGLVANCAIIASSHGGIFHKRYRKQRVICAYRRFADKVSCVTVLNTAMADALQQRFGSLFAAEIIPNGIEDSWLAAPPERQKDILLGAGRLSADKCYDLAIDAYAASQSRQHLALVIAGEGDTEAELEARASAQQLAVLREMPTKARANTVYFSGYQTGANKMELFARARLLLHPSRFEAFGIVLLEAMAQKALPVCADLPTYRSQFAADRFHLQYITPYEVQAWARGIDECGDAAELAAAVAANHSAVAAFAWSRIFQRYLACYQAAAAGP
jgi:glycosyltransferase involved in cell wall biosynthesis